MAARQVNVFNQLPQPIRFHVRIADEKRVERKMVSTDVEYLLEYLDQLMKSVFWRRRWGSMHDAIDSIYKDLPRLRDFINKSDEKGGDFERVKMLTLKISRVADEAASVIDSTVIGTLNWRKRSTAGNIGHFFYPHRKLRRVKRKVRSLAKAVEKIDFDGDGEKQSCLTVGTMEAPTLLSKRIVSGSVRFNQEEKMMVGFEDELEKLRDRLTNSSKPLDIISIVGMAGLGKTTLAKMLYNDPYVVYHFYVRGWTSVSHSYDKSQLLLQILDSLVEHKEEVENISDEKLAEKLYKCLKGKRYLIVMDDIWSIDAWNELKMIFPNDRNGSRILFTSRFTEMAKHTRPEGCPYFLRFLTQEESWELLQKKVFGDERCPEELMGIGNQISDKCRGLPLAIVVIAGLLSKTIKTRDWWEQIAERVSSHIADSNHCLDKLELSYNHLPRHLKACFLYLGAFPEDHEISAKKLIWLWIAEGFVVKFEDKTLEQVAEMYLMDLVERSLMLVSKRRPTGEIKACLVHDLVREFCLSVAKENDFLWNIRRPEESFSERSLPKKKLLCLSQGFRQFKSSLNKIEVYKQPRLCIHIFSSSSRSSSPFESLHLPLNAYPVQASSVVRSILCFTIDQGRFSHLNFFRGSQGYKLLTVLDLAAIRIMGGFPRFIVDLVLLKYLALRGKCIYEIPETVCNLWNLETFLIMESASIEFPYSIWQMTRLRNLHVAGASRFVIPRSGDSSNLNSLQTISQLNPSHMARDFFRRMLNLKKLTLCGNFILANRFIFPDMDFLDKLESVKMLNRNCSEPSLFFSCNFQLVKFPPSLKRLTLSLTYLDWKEMSVLGMLPRLEALKLEYQACIGPRWDAVDGGFHQLKFLKLCYMSIE